MKISLRAASNLLVAAAMSLVWSGGHPSDAAGQAASPGVDPLHFHHVHLNSVDPATAAAYYPRPFGKTAVQTRFNGFDAVKTGNVYILFTKVASPPTNELNGPQTAFWHFGWNTPNSREYNTRFRSMGLTIAQMWNGSDAGAALVDLSGDVPTAPGGGFPTEEQVLAFRAKGVTVDPSTTAGGFGYLRGPDGVLIENAQLGDAERFNHVHMYHEHPNCAMQWYQAHLGARRPAQGGQQAAQTPSSGDCETLWYSPPTFPSFAKGGFVREPSGGVLFDDISISIRPWPGGGLASTRGRLYDHWALSSDNLDATMARLRSEGVKVLEDIRPWGDMRAAMIEGPDRVAIEIVGR